jgi:hypothetical protein
MNRFITLANHLTLNVKYFELTRDQLARTSCPSRQTSSLAWFF